jgi:hypothetical protein
MEIICRYKGWCCDKGENGDCLASEDSICDQRIEKLSRREIDQLEWQRYLHSNNHIDFKLK